MISCAGLCSRCFSWLSAFQAGVLSFSYRFTHHARQQLQCAAELTQHRIIIQSHNSGLNKCLNEIFPSLEHASSCTSMQTLQLMQQKIQHQQAVLQLALCAGSRPGCKSVTLRRVSPVQRPSRSHNAASWSLYHTLPMHGCCIPHQAVETPPGCEWRVERFEGRAAVQQLPQVWFDRIARYLFVISPCCRRC